MSTPLYFSAEQKMAAIKLAIAYEAYTHAKDDDNIICWGELLLQRQELTGCCILPTETIQNLVNRAKVRKARELMTPNTRYAAANRILWGEAEVA